MTRIGRCQIKPHNLLAMLPPGETISPAQIFQTKLSSGRNGSHFYGNPVQLVKPKSLNVGAKAANQK
jgi:hypothetical protein